MLLGIHQDVSFAFSVTGLSPSMVQYSAVSLNEFNVLFDVPQPRKKFRFRLVPFRSPLLRESRLLSIPLATKMFQFTRLSLSCL